MEQVLAKKKFNYYGWYIVFISAFMGCTISAAFPQFSMTVNQLAQEMNVSAQLLLAGDTVKSAAIVVSMLISGFVYKKIGAKNTFIFALIATVLPQFLLPYTSSIYILMMLKVLQGLSSIIFPVFLLIIMDSIENTQTGLATAIFNGIFYGGGGIGGTFAGFIIASKGWEASYIAVGIVEIVVGIIWLLTVKDPQRNASKEPRIEDIDSVPTQISTKKLILMPQVWLLIIGFFSTTYVLQAITVDLPIFSDFLGYDSAATGKIMTAVTIGMFLACLVSGKISDVYAGKSKNRAKARIYTLMIGPMIIILASLFLMIANLNNFFIFYFAAFFFSFGAAWGLGTFYSILPEMFDKETLPIITGFSGGIGDIGMPLAPLVVGVVFGFNGLWNLGWASCAILGVLSIIACLILCRQKIYK